MRSDVQYPILSLKQTLITDVYLQVPVPDDRVKYGAAVVAVRHEHSGFVRLVVDVIRWVWKH